MQLQDCDIVNATPAAKPYKLADGLGLYLLVQPSGAKLWRLDVARLAVVGDDGDLSANGEGLELALVGRFRPW